MFWSLTSTCPITFSPKSMTNISNIFFQWCLPFIRYFNLPLLVVKVVVTSMMLFKMVRVLLISISSWKFQGSWFRPHVFPFPRYFLWNDVLCIANNQAKPVRRVLMIFQLQIIILCCRKKERQQLDIVLKLRSLYWYARIIV